MAHGIPDFYRGVDIAYQALAQLLVRPTYGGAMKAGSVYVVGAGETKTMLTISGKGMIYGGFVTGDAAAAHVNDAYRLALDGQTLVNDQLNYYNTWNLNSNRGLITYLLKYDTVNHDYCLGVSYGLTFESSVEVKWVNVEATTIAVYTLIYYGLV